MPSQRGLARHVILDETFADKTRHHRSSAGSLAAMLSSALGNPSRLSTGILYFP